MAVDVTVPAAGAEVGRRLEPPPPLIVERWQPDARGRMARYGVMALLVGVALLLTAIVPNVYTNLVARAAVFGIVALSMNILVGYAGQVSLGHAAFFGAGAFSAGYALTELDLPWVLGLFVAALSGGLAALLLGAVALRVRGLYLALVTISYGLFAQEVVFNISALTGGGAGMIANRPSWFTGDLAYAYLCIGFLALFLVFDILFAGSRAGRAVRALKDSERVAASWGINVTAYKLLAFVLSGLIAAIAGGLFASIEQVVAPADFQFQLSLTFLLMTVVGGAGHRWGVIQGGFLFALLPTLLEVSHNNWHVPPFTWMDPTLETVISAGLLILTLTLYPGGIAQQQHHLASWLGGRRFKAHDEDPLTHPPVVRREGEEAPLPVPHSIALELAAAAVAEAEAQAHEGEHAGGHADEPAGEPAPDAAGEDVGDTAGQAADEPAEADDDES